MLTRTYIHAQGIGPTTEQRLWDRGYHCWQDCIRSSADLPVRGAARDSLLKTSQDSIQALQTGNSRYFARTLPQCEHWRCVGSFSRVGFLDIETDGGETVTVIGLYDGATVRQYVRGHNLHRFADEICEYDLLVTFFGSGFDLPLLRRAFGLSLDVLHLDLCHSLRRLGYSGGLKSIERMFGIRRSDRTRGLNGWDAVRLWREYRYGRDSSLDTLLAYNAEDVVNLAPLVQVACEGLSGRLMSGQR